jgi:universal stress protein E
MKILCATDLMCNSDSVIDRAGMLAANLGAELSLLHVVPPMESEKMQEHELLRAGGQLRSRATAPLWRYGPAPIVRVEAGNPKWVLVDTMKELRPDLLVMGSHRQRPVWDYVVGTIATQVLGERLCAVLIVNKAPRDRYHNVVLALDGTKLSVETVRVAEALVVKDGMRATIVHARLSPEDGALSSIGIAGDVVPRNPVPVTYDARAMLSALLVDVSKNYARYDILLEDATPTAAIENIVGRLKADLLVVGTHGRGRLGRALRGSVSKRVLANAPCDVLVVPDKTGLFTPRRREAQKSSRLRRETAAAGPYSGYLRF